MPPQATKPSTPRLSELAKHVVAPKGAVSTGWPAVETKCTELGISFKLWQSLLGKIILSKRASGKYAATIGGTGMSIPRQVGKTYLVAGIVFALCLLFPGLTVIWTAHRLRTAEETFAKMQAFTKRRKIKPHILQVFTGSGDEEIRFHNGSRILFGARERGFGRGFDEVDVLIFDEAQILSDNALDDMIPATNQSRQPSGALLLFMGTPPKPNDPGEVFTRMRTEALSGEDDDTGWVEFGADEDFRPTPTPEPLSAADWKQVAKANPSYPDLTPPEAILRMRKKLGADSFLREGLGIWDAEPEGGLTIYPMAEWSALKDAEAKHADGANMVFACDMSWDRLHISISIAEPIAATGRDLVKVIAVIEPSQVKEFFNPRIREYMPLGVAIQGNPAPSGSLQQVLTDLGLSVTVMNGGHMAQAAGTFLDAIRSCTVTHTGDADIDQAMTTAVERRLDTGWVIDRMKSPMDTSGVVAMTQARWLLRKLLGDTDYDLAGSVH